MLVGFRRQGNLGLGYLAATLEEFGYRVEVVDFEAPASAVVEAVRRLDPVLVGFSLIFQFHVHRFEALARRRCARGRRLPFHDRRPLPEPQQPAETLRLVPQLDSVVPFEGELTLLELVRRHGCRRAWQAIDGLVYADSGELVTKPVAGLLPDLDELPIPTAAVDTTGRSSGAGQAQLIMASRGCARTCSFCSIHMFYRLAPGKVVRTRAAGRGRPRDADAPRRARNATLFLFQDDDFPMRRPHLARAGAGQLLDETRGRQA